MSDIQHEEAECLFLPYYTGKDYDLDPIRIILYDYGNERGKMIVVECFGDAYSHYWGAMGTQSVLEFVCQCGEDYLVDKLMPNHLHGTRMFKQQEVHLRRIVRRVQEALRAMT
jgi:hypothetical protein